MRRILKTGILIVLAALGCFLIIKLVWFGDGSEVAPTFDFSKGEAVFDDLQMKKFSGSWKKDEAAKVDEHHERRAASSVIMWASLSCNSTIGRCQSDKMMARKKTATRCLPMSTT